MDAVAVPFVNDTEDGYVGAVLFGEFAGPLNVGTRVPLNVLP